MLAAAIILSILTLLALLRIGLIVEYNDGVLALWLKVGFLRIRLKYAEDVKEKKRAKTKKLADLKPGSLREIWAMLKAVRNALRRIRRRLLIKKLIVHCTLTGDDPAAVALQYGAANAVFGVVMPLFERRFRVKEHDLRAFADFDAAEPSIYAKVIVSIAIWEVIYVASAILPMFSTANAAKMSDVKTQNPKRKDDRDNGKRIDRKYARDNDAKNQGNDRRKLDNRGAHNSA